MFYYMGILVFITGLCIGSFLNVCIYRIPRGESISYPPSHCTSCGKKIKSYDLIPVISYIILGGKCRNCQEKISVKYPIMEGLTGVLFVLIYLKYGISFELLKYCILTALLIVIGIIDLSTMDIYFKTILFGIVTGIIFGVIGYYLEGNIIQYVIGAAIGWSFIALIILITRGMGWGDAELCLVCGLYLGWKYMILTLFISVMIGAVSGVILILLKIKSKSDSVPFGPSISSGAIIAMLIGDVILKWYIR